MDADELMQAVRDEGLDTPVLDGQGRLHAGAVVLHHVGDAWDVYLVDERHAVIASTLRTYDVESDALERVLLKLRQVKRARHNPAAAADISEDIESFLKNFPGKSDDAVWSTAEGAPRRTAVRAVLDETLAVDVHTEGKTLSEIGAEVRSVLRARHPELTDAALRRLGNYFTYLVK